MAVATQEIITLLSIYIYNIYNIKMKPVQDLTIMCVALSRPCG